MRSFVLAAALLGAASALPAQQPAASGAAAPAAGRLPAGWLARLDRPNAKLEDLKFEAMGGGYHVTTGPSTILYDPGARASGNFTLSATFTQMKPSNHPEGYGLFIDGGELDGPGQNYAYFLVRQDGKAIVLHRAGADVHRIMEWTDHPAIVKVGESGKATNTLSVAVGADSVRFLVNGQPFTAIGRDHFGSADGIYGLRVNHNLDVHVADLKYTPPAP
ncbi:MAG TPA: hypothetical protein VFZ11_15450 [Gemmatimonadaceae bacterium]